MYTPNDADNNVIEQLRAYLPSAAQASNDILWVGFVNVWNKLMALLCWNDTSTKSLLKGNVIFSYVFEIYENPTRINLGHNPVIDIVSTKIRTFDSGGFNEYSVANPERFLIPNTNLYNLHLDRILLQKCINREVQAEIEYIAGYDEIPEELYTAITDIMFFSAGIQNCTDDDKAGAKACVGSKPAMNAYLKSKNIPDYSWTWEIPNHVVQDTLDNLYSEGNLSLIFGKYSNCINKLDFKGVVINV